jgi:AraC-like DNA-binding protein
MFYVSVAKLHSIGAHAPKSRSGALGTSAAVVDDRKAFLALLTASNAVRAGNSFAADQLVHDALLSLSGDVEDDDGAWTSRAALTRVRDYLQDRVGRSITVDELAMVAGISRFRLTRQFQRAFGLPLHAYHLHVRLEEAKRRLSAGAPIALVAVDLGFADQSHLHRRFKGAFGMTPAEWQRCTTIQDTPRASS